MRATTPVPNKLWIPFVLALLITGHARISLADKVCAKAALKRGKVTLTSSTVAAGRSCPRGTTQLVDTAILTGPQGPAGADGTDGSTRIYGNGSAGAVTVAADTTLSNSNEQYADLVINSGATFTAPSGTVIRSSGLVTINGTIRVSVGGIGGQTDSGNTATGLTAFSVLPATQGHAKNPAGAPEIGSNGALVYGGLAGRGAHCRGSTPYPEAKCARLRFRYRSLE